MNAILLGATAFAYATLGAFFARFYSRTRDRLFLIFAGAFFVLAVNRSLLGVLDRAEEHTILFVVRLVAFLLIAWAIIDKNRQSSSPRDDTP
jgi:cell shape-determining protein MreD